MGINAFVAVLTTVVMCSIALSISFGPAKVCGPGRIATVTWLSNLFQSVLEKSGIDLNFREWLTILQNVR